MKNLLFNPSIQKSKHKRGSTLVIVIALLSLLAFLGIMFYSFAAQERAAAENFSDAAKYAVEEPPNVFDHMLRQVIVGPGNSPSERTSILRSPEKRHSLVTNLVGNDIAPHTGEGIHLILEDDPATVDPTLVARVDMDGDGTAEDENGVPLGEINTQLLLDFVDSPVARFLQGYVERDQDASPNLPPTPDVDYTYPDINNLFLAYKGWAIRDNVTPPPGTPRFERVPVIIPSFFRPQYLKTNPANGPLGSNVPTDSNWASAFDGTNRASAPFPARSFRPHPLHIAGRLPNGSEKYRFLTDLEATGLGLTAGFPFLPADDINSGNGTAARGELGAWTGAHPGVYELDADNDGDGITEGIWLDLNYPAQETSAGQLYVILHSVTIYDLDALIDVNVHGNLAATNRIGNFSVPAGIPIRDGLMSNQFVSRSNLGLGPNEINPLWAMRRGAPPAGHASRAQFTQHFGRVPSNDLEQANMEWLWLLCGRGDFTGTTLNNLYAGRWGETERLYNAVRTGGTRLMEDLPRPGRSGNAQENLSAGIRFGGDYISSGRNGFDDNQDSYEGEADISYGRLRAYSHPQDYAGTGRTYTGTFGGYNGTSFATVNGSPRQPVLYHDTTSSGPERWLRYLGYSVNRAMDDTLPRYIFGQNETYQQGALAGDDLVADPFYDALFEDPLETIFDVDFAQRQFDQIFGPSDSLALHLTPADKASAPDKITERLTELAPFGFENVLNNDVRERFTTISNSLRRFMMKHDLGRDLQFGTADDGPRAWEFSADTDGADRNGDGYGEEGDGRLEFPPAFGVTPANGLPYSATDPFRPQVRRLLTLEAGETRELVGQLPLSINHILDVERSAQTPDELAQPVQFLRYMQRAGLRFRPLIEHPTALEAAVTPNVSTAPVVFPPQSPADREYWARRDRQKLARDIYVLLYTIGGAQNNGGSGIRDYRLPNNPNDVEGVALYTHRQLREMAQFAVNLVDAMDTDNVFTKFEYDKNLADGWNLDDDAYTSEGAVTLDTDANFGIITDEGRSREDNVTRGVVYGVEAQQFAFSEVLAVGATVAPPAATVNHAATLYPDQTGRNHLYIELQNMLPTPSELTTSLSTDMNRAIWRIVRYDREGIADPIKKSTVTGGNPFRAMAFRLDATVDQRVEGGQSYTIATASDNAVVSSDLFVDFDLDNNFDLIVPNKPGPAVPTNTTVVTDAAAPELKPRCDLDLIHPDHDQGFILVNDAGTDTTTTLGDFLALLKPYAGNTPMTDLYSGNFGSTALGFDLILQRRANPNMPSLVHGAIPGEDPNPWVDVDYIKVEFKDMGIEDSDTATELQNNRLPTITSEERTEPLSDKSRATFTSGTPPANFRFNTIGITNSGVGPAGFQLWQPHFDRDFASPGELLNLPLCSSGLLTHTLERARYAPYQQAFADPTTPTNPPLPRLLAGAASKLLQPDFPNVNAVPDVTDIARDNRWYRLFQFLEVPSRVHRMLGNYVSLSRVPGKLNLNTMRHWEVYAGLIDNPILLDREQNPVANSRFTTDRTPDSSSSPVNRDRWVEFLLARDGSPVQSFDPTPTVNAQRPFLLPGTPGARPFRSPGYRQATASDNGSESTVFRTLAADVNDGLPETNRNWLEIGDAIQHTTPGTTNTVHQHQLLSKIMNNSTTVSNTFIVYATAAYFEAVEDPPNSGIIRVGARLDLEPNAAPPTNPGWQQRAVFIIDRTEAFDAYDPGSGDFDWKRLIKARATIE